MDLSVIVVNYNTKDLLLNCLRSIYDTGGDVKFEALVVDNGSKDGSAEAVTRDFPQARLIANDRNLGFAKANNQALKVASGRYLLLLNSDAILQEGALKALIDFMDANPGAGCACGQLLNSDGSRQNSFSNFPTFASELLNKGLLRLLFPKRYPSKRQDFSHPVPVEAVIGACFIVRREVLEDVGPLDEDYFLFMEETDWCLRMRKAGWGIYFVPSARIFHLQGATVGKRPLSARIEFYRSRYIYFRKHKGRWAERMLRCAFILRLTANSILLSIPSLLSGRARSKISINLGLLWWHLRLCPEGEGLR